jgi:RNA polymerase sigma-70 factor (ECF subfamily)
VSDCSPDQVTELLIEWSNGDRGALDRLIPLVYDELHRLSARQIRKESPDHNLQTTTLINEAYQRLIDHTRVAWRNRAQFFGIAAQIMRRILVDYARSRRCNKRGGNFQNIELRFFGGLSIEETAAILKVPPGTVMRDWTLAKAWLHREIAGEPAPRP